MEKQYAWPHAISLYLNFLGCKTGFKTAMMIVPYEELPSSVVTEYLRAKGLGEKASRREEVQNGKQKATEKKKPLNQEVLLESQGWPH